MDEINCGLCGPGRHEIPNVSQYIFDSHVENPLDFKHHQALSLSFIEAMVSSGIRQINLYITGLTPVLTSFLKVWMQTNAMVGLTLYHYDRDEDTYIPQVMWMDISAWTDEQLISHGWTYEGIRYYRSLNVAPVEEENWYAEVKSSKSILPNGNKKYVLILLAIVLTAGIFLLMRWLHGNYWMWTL